MNIAWECCGMLKIHRGNVMRDIFVGGTGGETRLELVRKIRDISDENGTIRWDILPRHFSEWQICKMSRLYGTFW